MSQIFVKYLSVLFITFLFSNCQQTSTSNSALVKESITSTPDLHQNPTEEDNYQLSWGNVIIELEKHANPNGFKGETEIEQVEMLKNIEQPIQLLKNGAPLEAEIHTLYNNTPSRWRNSQWHPNPSKDHKNLEQEVIKKLRTGIQKGDFLVINMGSVNKDVYVAGAKIAIKDPFQAYQPKVKATWQRPSEIPFYFQVINQKGKESVLRIDTSAEESQKIYALYKDRKDYKILHVPNFKTHRRLLIDEDKLFTKYDIRRTELLGEHFDRWKMSEYTDYYRRKTTLNWGDMTAWINSENYSRDSFQLNRAKELVLKVDDKKLNIIGFDFIVKAGENAPIRFITNSLDVPEIQEQIKDLPTKSSIYFTNIIVEEKDIPLHFPVNFSFHIDDPIDFTMDIEETTKPLTEELFAGIEDDEYHIRITNKKLSEVIAWLLDTSIEKVYFKQLEQDPVINICYISPTLPIAYGKRELQNALEKKYQISPYYSWYEYYELSPVFPELLAGYRYPDRADNKRNYSFNMEDKVAKFHYTSMNYLSRQLTHEMRIAIINNTKIEGTYELELDLYSLETLQTQLLEEYGLELKPMQKDIEVVVSQYYE